MTATDFGALTIAQKRVWSAQLWKAGRDASFFFSKGFIGTSDTDTNAVIQRVTKLSKTERGLECVMQLVQDLVGDGVVGDNELEGNEEPMVNDAQVIRIDQIRNGVKLKGEMAEQATVIEFRSTGKDKLGYWLSDKMDELMFLTLSGRSYSLRTDGRTRANSQLPNLRFGNDVVAPSSGRTLYAGSAQSEASITSSDRFSWATVVRANQLAYEKRLRPLRNDGMEHYVCVLHPRQMAQLKLDPTYLTVTSRAGAQGPNNPLFKGAAQTIDGTVFYQHNKVFSTAGLPAGSKWGAGGTVDGAQALYLGAQAGGIATIEDVFWREASGNDYGNRPGIATGRKIGMLKPQFKSQFDDNTRQDFGCLSIKTAANPT